MFTRHPHRLFAAAGATFALVGAAHASFHIMQIEQIIGGVGGNTNAQAIQLRMRTGFQNQLQFARLISRDAAGANPLLLCDMTAPIPQTAGGTRILIATTAFAANTTPSAVPNYTMIPIPAARLAAGKISFEDDSGTIYWSVSYGNYTGANTGSLTNDANGVFGPPFAGPMPSSGAEALRFQGTETAMSTTNAADYRVTTGAASFNNALGTQFVVTPPCRPDFNRDGELNPDDLADYITCIFDTPPCATADYNADGEVNPDDVADYITDFFSGCA